MSPRSRRALGLVAVPALALSALVALPSGSANAAEPDPAPAAAGAAWLKTQLTEGLVFNPNFGGFNDYGLSIDLALALDEIGGEAATLDTISTALADEIAGYVGDGTVESYAGALAKASVFAQTAGDDPGAFGGVDLIDRLEARVSDTGATVGRIQDASAFGDFANTFDQTFAARALDEAGSSEAGAATEFLIAQQCTGDGEGFFRQDFSALDAADQSCDGAASAAPSTDVTALAVLALLPQADDTDVQAVIDDAVAWLISEQAANGSFGSGADIPAPNTNSSGLAGWALGEAGSVESIAAAEKAAVYVRALQVDEPEPCSTALNDDQGAIAYDVAALVAGREDGITVELEDQWRRASAQALPALQWAPGEPGEASDVELRQFYQAGTRVTLTANGFVPGDTVCFRRGSKIVGLAVVGFDGSAKLGTKLPKGTAKRTYDSNTDESEGQPLTFHVLDAKKLKVALKPKVAKGGKQVVKIRGMEKGESFKVVYRGERVDKGVANGKGRGTARFAVGKTTGPVKVLVRGEFKNRRGAKAFTVTR